MTDLVTEFNTTSNMFMDYIDTLLNDSEVKYYKKMMNRVERFGKKRLIENYIINCLPYYDYIINKDYNFFIDIEITTDKSLFNFLKRKQIFIILDENKLNIIFEYLILMSNYSKEYQRVKMKI